MAVDYMGDAGSGAATGAMIGGPYGAAIGGGAGLLKGLLIDGPQEQRQKTLAAATIRYSPWTGLKAQPIQYANPMGSAMQGATTGMQMQQNAQSAASTDALKQAMIQAYQRQGQAPEMNYGTGQSSDFGNPNQWRLGNYNYGTGQSSDFGNPNPWRLGNYNYGQG